MKKYFYLTITFIWTINGFGQNKPDKHVIGKYEYRRQEIKGAVAYSTVTIDIKKNKTFEYKADSHLFGAADDKGKWKISGDTLILKSDDKSIEKYLISKKRLCSIPEEKSEKPMCLDLLK